MAGFINESAVKVLETELIEVEENNVLEERKRIKIVHKCRQRSPSLEDILLNDEFRDKPLYIFSIAGKMREGKSVFLNLMIKYLESQLHSSEDQDWISGKLPKVFPWSDGDESVTKGLWISPKIYKRENCDKKEVGILLLDNEGMFSHDTTDGEVIAISGISTGISYLQIFNCKETISKDYLESIARNLVRGVEEVGEGNKHDMMFLVRDRSVNRAELKKCGLETGQKYLQYIQDKANSQTKLIWKEIERVFPNIQCLTLPFPGDMVKEEEFTTSGDLSLLKESFLSDVKKTVEEILAPVNLKPPLTVITSQDIYNTLMKADGQIADESFCFFNVYKDIANAINHKELVDEFDKKMEHAATWLMDFHEIRAFSEYLKAKAKKKLTGKSGSAFFEELVKYVNDQTNCTLMTKFLEKYKSDIRTGVGTKNHTSTWNYYEPKLNLYLCGNSDVQIKIKEKIAKRAATLYYSQLREEEVKKVEKQLCRRNLESLPAGFEKFYTLGTCQDFGEFANNHDAIYPIWLQEQESFKESVVDMILERVHQLTGETVQALKTARRKQLEFYERFTMLNQNEETTHPVLKRNRSLLIIKVGFALFGKPQCTFSSQQSALIELLVNKIYSLAVKDTIDFFCIFITFKDQASPLFGVQISPGHTFLVDSNCRVYKGIKDFLQSNELRPDIVYCYPAMGCYNKKHGFSVAFAKPPSSKTGKKVVKVADTVNKGVGLTALGLGLVGLAVPPVGAAALVVGGISGVYGFCRGMGRIVDKKRHKQRVTGWDGLSLGADLVAVAGVGAAGIALAEKGVMWVFSKAAVAFTTARGFVVTIHDEDVINIHLLQQEVNQDALNVLFYFNASSSRSAIDDIRRILKRENVSTAEVLKILVDVNSIKSTIELQGDVKLEHYVTLGLYEVVKSLLRNVNYNVRGIVENYVGIHNTCKQLQINPTSLSEQNVQLLFKKLEDIHKWYFGDNDEIRTKIWKIALKMYDDDSRSTTPLKKGVISRFSEHLHDGGQVLLMLLRHMACSIANRVTKANRFFSEIEHEGKYLQGYGVQGHTIREVKRYIRAKTEQADPTAELLTEKINNDMDNGFLIKVLTVLFELAEPDWTEQQFVDTLRRISDGVRKVFENEFKKHKSHITEKIKNNSTCSDLENYFEENGCGINLGNKILDSVLKSFIENNCMIENLQDNTATNQERTRGEDFIVVPAWSALREVSCYSARRSLSDYWVLLKSIKNVDSHTYTLFSLPDHIKVFRSHSEQMPIFVVYSTVEQHGVETGLICMVE